MNELKTAPVRNKNSKSKSSIKAAKIAEAQAL